MALFRCGSGSSVKYKTGTFNGSTSGTTKITLGFKPKNLNIHPATVNETYNYQYTYSEDVSATQYEFSGGTSSAFEALGGTTNNRLKSIDDDGFTMNTMGSAIVNNTWYYFAIG